MWQRYSLRVGDLWAHPNVLCSDNRPEWVDMYSGMVGEHAKEIYASQAINVLLIIKLLSAALIALVLHRAFCVLVPMKIFLSS